MATEKSVYYAFPSSVVAVSKGMASTGCYYVYIDGKIVSAHIEKADAIASAEMFPHPWGKYSQHKDA